MNQYDPRYQTQPYYDPYYELECKRPLRRWGNIIGGGLLLVQVVMLAVFYLLSYVFSLVDTNALSPEVWSLIDQSIEIISYVLGFWIPTAFIATLIRIPAHVAFPIRRVRPSLVVAAVFLCLGVSMLGSLVSGSLTVFFETVFDLTPSMPDMSSPDGIGANVVYVISMTVAPAIFEEAMFRGVILQSLRRFGDGFALITSSILFGLIHGNLLQGPNAMLLGLVMGYFVLRTGSLLPAIIVHFCNNGLVVVLNYLMDYVLTEQQSLVLDNSIFGLYLLLGAAALVYLIARKGITFRVARSDYPLRAGQKYGTLFCSVTMVLFLLYTVWLTILYFE